MKLSKSYRYSTPLQEDRVTSGKNRRRGYLGIALLPLFVGLLTPFAAGGAESPVVTAAAQVTSNANPVRAHSSPQIARNPKTGELAIAETDIQIGKRCAVHISADDGRSWFPGGDPMMAPFTDCSSIATSGPYFTLEFDSDGVLYMSFQANDPKLNVLPRSDRARHVFLARSTDGGRSFETSFVYRVPDGLTDDVRNTNRRPMVAVDPVNHRNVYVGWWQTGTPTNKRNSLIAASTDGGRTFGEPIDMSDERGGTQPRPAVTADGVAHIVYQVTPFFAAGQSPPIAEQPVRPLLYRRSTDQGRTWSPPVEVDQGNAWIRAGRRWVLKADPNSSSLYVVWTGNPKTRVSYPEDDMDIYMRASTDGGKTWSDRRLVNDDAPMAGVQHSDPGISIAPNGRVDIAWYDFRNSPSPEIWDDNAPFSRGGMQDVYYASSADQGRTFTKNVRITDRSIDRSIGVWSNNVHSTTTVGISSTNDSVYFTWQDSRNGNASTNAEDAYFASLKLTGSDPADETPALAPRWVLLGSGLLMGLGVAMSLVWLTGQRRTAG